MTDYTELIKALRELAEDENDEAAQAADAIEELQAELQRMVEAEIHDGKPYCFIGQFSLDESALKRDLPCGDYKPKEEPGEAVGRILDQRDNFENARIWRKNQ